MGQKAAPQVAVATCPDCGEKISVQGKIHLGKEVICPNCEAELEVVETVPVELDWACDEDDDSPDGEDDEEYASG